MGWLRQKWDLLFVPRERSMICINVMLLTQLFTLGFMSQRVLAPAAVILMSDLVVLFARYGRRVWGRWSWLTGPNPPAIVATPGRVRGAMLGVYFSLILVTVAGYLLLPMEFPWSTVHFGYREAYFLALFFFSFQCLQRMAMQANRWFKLNRWSALREGVGGYRGQTLPIYGVLVMLFSGNRNCDAQIQTLYMAVSILYVCAAALYYIDSRPYRESTRAATTRARRVSPTAIIARVLILGGVVAFTSLGSRYFFDHQDELDQMLASLLLRNKGGPDYGFPDTAILGSIGVHQFKDGDRVALRIESEREPGYLRARVYNWLEDSKWEFVNMRRAPMPENATAPLREYEHGGRRIFRWRTSELGEWSAMNIQPAGDRLEAMFLPLSAGAVAIRYDRLFRDRENVIQAPALPPGTGYLALSPLGGEPLPIEEERLDERRYLQLPHSVDRRVRELAGRLFHEGQSRHERVEIVRRYFQQNFEYRLGIHIPPGEDPLGYFLESREPAHCEYFATAGALLLRLGEVPCRYVTGFLVSEHNGMGDYWIARGRHAHAWVEALSDNGEWRTVEFTVPAGVPTEGDRGVWQWWEYFSYQWLRLSNWLTYGTLSEKASAAWRWFVGALQWLASPGGGTLLATIAFVALLLWARRPNRETRTTQPEGERELWLRALDRRLAMEGLERGEHETLDRFAARIERTASEPDDRTPDRAALLKRAAAWYRALSTHCYRPGSPPEAAADLAAQAERLAAIRFSR